MSKFIVYVLLAVASLNVIKADDDTHWIGETWDNDHYSNAIDGSVSSELADGDWSDEEYSEAGVKNSHADEIRFLNGDQRIFEKFCIDSRDFVFNDIRKTSNGAAAKLFDFLFKNIEGIQQEALDTQRQAVDTLSEQIRNPETAIETPTNEREAIIAEGQKLIQKEPSQPKSFLHGVGFVIKAVTSALGHHVGNTLNNIKNVANFKQSFIALQTACQKIDQYSKDLNRQYEEFRRELIETGSRVSNLHLDDINCSTSKKVLKVNDFCAVFKAANEPLQKIFLGRPDRDVRGGEIEHQSTV